MIRIIAVGGLVAVLIVGGCHRQPLRFRGDMNLDGNIAATLKNDNTASRLSAVTVSGQCDSPRRVAVVEVDGLLVNRNFSGLGSQGENPVALFREKLDAIACDPSIAAIVLRINSPGGGVTASDIMSHDLQRIKLGRQIPVVNNISVSRFKSKTHWSDYPPASRLVGLAVAHQNDGPGDSDSTSFQNGLIIKFAVQDGVRIFLGIFAIDAVVYGEITPKHLPESPFQRQPTIDFGLAFFNPFSNLIQHGLVRLVVRWLHRPNRADESLRGSPDPYPTNRWATAGRNHHGRVGRGHDPRFCSLCTLRSELPTEGALDWPKYEM